MKDFEKDGQRYRFEGRTQRGAGVRLHFSSRCAICEKVVNFYPASFENATATPIRRCYRHRLGGARVGSRAEAVAIASNGWRVTDGSLLAEMRREGRAWTATVETSPPAGVAQKTPKKREKELLGHAYLMVQAIAARGPLSAVAAAIGSDMSYDYACVLAGRLVGKGMLTRVRHGVYEATERGRKAVSAPDPITSVGGGSAVGLFD